MLSNFYSTKPSRINNVSSFFPNEEAHCWLGEISERFQMRVDRLERAESTIWHSVREWCLGYASASLLLERCHDVAQKVSRFLERNVSCELKGQEIFEFYQKGWPMTRDVAVRIPRHAFETEISSLYIKKICSIYKQAKRLNVADFCTWTLSAQKKQNFTYLADSSLWPENGFLRARLSGTSLLYQASFNSLPLS